MVNIINRRILILLLLVLGVGVAFIWREAQSTDKLMREAFLEHENVAAQAINLQRVVSLSGSEKDLGNPDYMRIKLQLSLMRNAMYQCRFLYLMGQRSDGTVFFFADSLSEDSEDYAPPGLVYTEVPDSYRHVFDTRQEAVIGPVTDRWGTLMTALVPLIDPQTKKTVAVLGMDIDANDWHKKILSHCLLPFMIMLFFAVLVLFLAYREQTIKLRHESIVEGITERTRVKAALEKSEKQFRDLFNSITDLIYTQDMEGCFTSANPALQKLFGYNMDEFLGHRAIDFMKPEFQSDFNSQYLDVIKEQGHHEGIACYFKKNKGKIYIEYKSSLVKLDGREPYISGIGRDVTERILSERKVKKLQKQVVQAQRIETIGVLAGGIAHDFNNLLFAIMGNISLAEYDMKPEIGMSENLTAAETACLKAKELTGRLITFSKGGDPIKRMTSIDDVIKEAVTSAVNGSGINLEIFMPDTAGQVNIDENQIKQVIRHIVINAREAMADNGHLKVFCENIEISKKDSLALNFGNYIKISFEDQGCGISKENLSKIFDPYFSTKDMGANKGQGLGLAASYSIIKRHGGVITAASELKKGSIVSVYLPAGVAKPATSDQLSKGNN